MASATVADISTMPAKAALVVESPKKNLDLSSVPLVSPVGFDFRYLRLPAGSHHPNRLHRQWQIFNDLDQIVAYGVGGLLKRQIPRTLQGFHCILTRVSIILPSLTRPNGLRPCVLD